MKIKLGIGVLFLWLMSGTGIRAHNFTSEEIQEWEQQAKKVTIIRDRWGVPHIYAKSNKDVVFGSMYAQCEDDFRQIEENFIYGLGRSSELYGKENLMDDLWMRLYFDHDKLKELYINLPLEYQELLTAHANGINYYLYKHPEVKPKLLNRFEPWFHLAFSEGSSEGNGANITNIRYSEIAAFFLNESIELNSPGKSSDQEEKTQDDGGSNGFVIAPGRTRNGNALMLINPHVSLYHRNEIHMISGQGLNAHGAVSKGQIYIYHGFNEKVGWVRTSTGVYNQDAYLLEKVVKNGIAFYKHGKELRRFGSRKITLAYKEESGSLKTKEFKVLDSHHGPVVAEREGKLVAITPLHEPEKEIMQQWQTMLAKDLNAFKKVLKIRSNVSNNTLYADSEGNIAFWNGNFVPKRDPDLDWINPVESSPESDWQGIHTLEEVIQVINPESGWIQNCNSTPFRSSGKSSPKEEDYPWYMAGYYQNSRASNAIRLLSSDSSFTMEKLRQAAFDQRMKAFEISIPSLVEAFDSSSLLEDSIRDSIEEPIDSLRSWDMKNDTNNTVGLVASQWINFLMYKYRDRINSQKLSMSTDEDPEITVLINNTSAKEKLLELYAVVAMFSKEIGTWKIPYGNFDRFQRSGSEPYSFDASKPSYPIWFMEEKLGSLATASYKYDPESQQSYMVSGNSYVAVIEFGKRITAKSILPGGQSADPSSKHFNDQSFMFCSGELKDVYFYKKDVLKNKESKYRPGREKNCI